MPDKDDFYRAILAHEERFAYFHLAGAGACIGYSLARLDTLPSASWAWFAVGGIILWGLSFFIGSQYLLHRRTLLNAHLDREYEKAEDRPDLQTMGKLRRNILRERDITTWLAGAQFWLFYVGALAYIVGQAWRVVAR
jgi:hypothetical protein